MQKNSKDGTLYCFFWLILEVLFAYVLEMLANIEILNPTGLTPQFYLKRCLFNRSVIRCMGIDEGLYLWIVRRD